MRVFPARELREAVVGGSLDPECAVVNAQLVPDLLALHLSAHRALAAQARGVLRTKTLHAELVYGLSGSRNVSARVWQRPPERACARTRIRLIVWVQSQTVRAPNAAPHCSRAPSPWPCPDC